MPTDIAFTLSEADLIEMIAARYGVTPERVFVESTTVKVVIAGFELQPRPEPIPPPIPSTWRMK